MTGWLASIVLIAPTLAPCAAPHGPPPDDVVTRTAAPADERDPWPDVGDEDHAIVRGTLESPDWPFRAIALVRLDRYSGDEVTAMVERSLRDDAWQVRCFAIRQAQRLGMSLADNHFAEENEPRVIRAAVRAGFNVPAEVLDPLATKLLATRTVDDLMLGLELAACSKTPAVREDAGKRITRLVERMDDGLAALLGPRLARVLDLPRGPEDIEGFRTLLRERGGTLKLPSLLPGGARTPPLPPRSPLAEMSNDRFARLRDYLGGLRQRDLDLVLVMDATASMLPMINEARAGVDSLILFMNELSRTMRLAFIAYRDHDNAPVWEGERFTDNINTIRDFLFKVRITGGADYPEAVYDGIAACRDLNWRKAATRIIVLIGDAPPHPDDESKLMRELEWHEQRGNVVHALHVPMRITPRMLASMPAQRAAELQLQYEAYNASTRAMFENIARKAGGRCATVTEATELVPAVMHCTIEPEWHDAFDEFYKQYVSLCR